MYLRYRYDYDSQTSSVFVHNCKMSSLQRYSSSQQQQVIKGKRNSSELLEQMTHRLTESSCFFSCWSTSISIIAASRYLSTARIILIATISLFSLSQHSNTWPKVPVKYGKKNIWDKKFMQENEIGKKKEPKIITGWNQPSPILQ